MSFQGDIYNALASDTAIASLAGNRVFADIADGTAITPYIVFQVISTSSTTTHDGSRNIEFPMIQITCWAATKAAAITLASAVNAACNGITHDGSSDLLTVFSGQSGTYDPETKLFGEILEYQAANNPN